MYYELENDKLVPSLNQSNIKTKKQALLHLPANHHMTAQDIFYMIEELHNQLYKDIKDIQVEIIQNTIQNIRNCHTKSNTSEYESVIEFKTLYDNYNNADEYHCINFDQLQDKDSEDKVYTIREICVILYKSFEILTQPFDKRNGTYRFYLIGSRFNDFFIKIKKSMFLFY